MVDTEWPDLEGQEVQYRDADWELTGEVDVQRDGTVIAAAARRTDDNQHGTARLSFQVQDAPASLNPGNLGTHFNRIDRSGADPAILVKGEGRTYRYSLERLEYQ
ncbi:MAG: hypothetical protein V5A43_01585 [Haloarculaceae archaeon]